jgi:hypothetical protein
MKRVESFLNFCEQKRIPKCICFYMHPWEFHPMEKSFHFGEATVIPDEFITRNCGKGALDELAAIIDKFQGMGARFCTARELAQYLPEV